jgi:hypothetical protein
MAGGMNKRGRYGSMADRLARTRGDGAAADPPPAPPPVVKHCWVTTVDGRLPGLLLAWERRSTGWHGRVVHPVADEHGWILADEWLPATLLDALP